MSFGTFGALKSELALWLGRGDLTAQIPSFVSLLEADLKRNEAIQYETTAVLILDDETVTLPTDCREVRAIALDADAFRGSLDMVSVDLLPQVKLRYAPTGIPRAFATITNGTVIQLAPVPDGTYTSALNYWATLTALSADGDTNWVLTSHPDVYLYGSLMQAEPYIENDQRVRMWAEKYQAGLDAIKQLRERQRWGSTPLVVRPRQAMGV